MEQSLSGPKAATGGVPRPRRSLPGLEGPPEPRSTAGEGPGPSRAPRSAPPGPPDSPARRGRAPFVPTGRGGGDGACALRSALSTRWPRPAGDSLLTMGGPVRLPRAPPRGQGRPRTLRDGGDSRGRGESAGCNPSAARAAAPPAISGTDALPRGVSQGLPRRPQTLSAQTPRSSPSPAPGTPVTVPRVLAAGGESAAQNGRAGTACARFAPAAL
ncbi:basic salivary proline-rich protein 1-like [Vidua macroura]|uniref:basic salivary proline-rich protein 1-like n=1 Tax=Vidua macroura TaxID=187451 RepID=UPI0023A8C83E|nr:basic salivary proline-rich protein 1-like [Vidua macroura]XP_053856234.1 basic salivary proline-rich protein 1-like [Vidua macroura]